MPYFESRDDETEADIACAPAVCFVLESDEVGPCYDEPVGTHLARRVVARDVRLQQDNGWMDEWIIVWTNGWMSQWPMNEWMNVRLQQGNWRNE